MKQRFNYRETEPAAYAAMSQLESYVRHCGLDKRLLHLIKVRASQINGCAFCLDMHTHEARQDGETEQRLYTLSAWRETPFFSPAERAALAYTEQVTLIANGGVSPEVLDELERHFTPPEIVRLTLAIVTINGWNRIAISGGAQPPQRH